MQSSRRQLDILNEWQQTDNNILISAVAGSGKTTTLLMLLEKCEYITLFVAFNKSIQVEIQNKMDQKDLKQGKALTMHSLGLSAIRASGKRFSINSSKNWNLIKKIQLEFKRVYRKLEGSDKMRLNYTLIDMNDTSRMYLVDDIEEIKKYMIQMDKVSIDIPELEEIWERFIEIRADSYEESIIEIDFYDMIYLPVIKNLHIPIYPYYLMIDECQDMNLCQHKLIDKLLEQGSIRKWIAVGDRNQAIYGFAGAFATSFDLFLSKSNNIVEKPLDICYRCARKIVESANKVYNVMEAAKENEGIVENITEIDNIKPNSMIICRNSKPLFDLYFKLLGLGIPSYINGSDLMNQLVKFLKNYINDTVYSAKIEMQYTYESLCKEESEDGKIRAYYFKENYDNFLSISSNMCKSTNRIEHLIEDLKMLFENRTNAIMLCTIHKAKGLENDIVYILNESLIPSKLAKSNDQKRQEKNLQYVARTRAKEEMYFLDIESEETIKLEEI